MIRVLFYLFIILLGLCLSPYFVGNTGYVYVAAWDYQIETSLVFAVIALVCLFSLLQLLEWIIVFAINLVLNSRYLPARWRKQAARKNTLLGALSLAEEDWATAEQAMLKGADKGEIPALNLLAAARAAQHQGKSEERDHYLERAAKEPAASTAVSTTRTRYLMQLGQLDSARIELDRLNPTSKSKLPVLSLAKDLYQAQEDWQAMKLLLPTIKKRHLLTDDEFISLTRTTNLALLEQASQANEQELEKTWHWLSRSERGQVEYLAIYAKGLCLFGRKEEALKLLMKKLKNQASSEILAVLPQMLTQEDAQVIEQLESFEQKYLENADYQVCMAKLYQAQKAFKEAKVCWQRACEHAPSKELWLSLADVQEHLGEHFGAIQSYRNAVHL